jgi:hypothetical protein
MKRTIFCLSTLFLLVSSIALAQYAPPDCEAVEGIIVERYYISDGSDASDQDGGELVTGSTTWRVFVDLKSDYVLQSVFGSEANPLSMETTSEFFNNEDRGDELGDAISANRLGDNTVALDSYITLSAASDEHLGVLKSEDTNGQIIAGLENDGGSEGAEDGLLINDLPEIGIPLTDADGLVEGTIISAGTGEIAAVTTIGLDASTFADENSSAPFIVGNGAWAVLGGVVGPTDANRILIAQITTDGVFSFELNMRIGIPEELQCNTSNCHEDMDFVAVMTSSQMVASIANDRICTLDGLTFNSATVGTDDRGFAAEGFSLYPNPTQDAITIALNPNRADQFTYRIFDIYGRLLEAGNPNQSFRGMLSLDVSDLPIGTYLVEVENQGERATKRFVKQ